MKAKQTLLTRTLALSLALALAGCAAVSSSSQSAARWQALFNGKDLQGWQHVGPGRFVIENGLLKTEGGMGLLWYTPEQFADTTLRVVFHVPDAAHSNSGVFIRIPAPPTEPWMPVHKGYEVQIDQSADDTHRTGVLYSFTKARAKPALREWNTLEITLQGLRTTVVMNGETITDFREGDAYVEPRNPGDPAVGPRQASGYIGLQNHSAKDLVLFREVSVLRH